MSQIISNSYKRMIKRFHEAQSAPNCTNRCILMCLGIKDNFIKTNHHKDYPKKLLATHQQSVVLTINEHFNRNHSDIQHHLENDCDFNSHLRTLILQQARGSENFQLHKEDE